MTCAVINHDINIAYDNFLMSYYKTGRDIANMPYPSSITSQSDTIAHYRFIIRTHFSILIKNSNVELAYPDVTLV